MRRPQNSQEVTVLLDCSATKDFKLSYYFQRNYSTYQKEQQLEKGVVLPMWMILLSLILQRILLVKIPSKTLTIWQGNDMEYQKNSKFLKKP